MSHSEPNWRIQKLTLTTSTNDDMRKLAEAGEPAGCVLVAESQTAGRGRQHRVWASPPGNLYCSLLVRPPRMPEHAPLYSFVAALAVRETVASVLAGKTVTLKWPNDILVHGKKISGVLIEVVADALVVGVGMNIRSYPEVTSYPATSLSAEGGDGEASEVLNILLDRWNHYDEKLQAAGFAGLRKLWLQHAEKGRLRVRQGNAILEGLFKDLDEQGRLCLQLDDGSERVISTGDVFFEVRP